LYTTGGYYKHYARIGLSHSRNIVWDISRTVARHPDCEISVFGDADNKVSSDVEWLRQLDQGAGLT